MEHGGNNYPPTACKDCGAEYGPIAKDFLSDSFLCADCEKDRRMVSRFVVLATQSIKDLDLRALGRELGAGIKEGMESGS